MESVVTDTVNEHSTEWPLEERTSWEGPVIAHWAEPVALWPVHEKLPDAKNSQV